MSMSDNTEALRAELKQWRDFLRSPTVQSMPARPCGMVLDDVAAALAQQAATPAPADRECLRVHDCQDTTDCEIAGRCLRAAPPAAQAEPAAVARVVNWLRSLPERPRDHPYWTNGFIADCADAADVIAAAPTPAAQAGDELPPFDDAAVQTVYKLLCIDDAPPDQAEHWEGWLARRIVAALAARGAQAGDELPPTDEAQERAAFEKAMAAEGYELNPRLYRDGTYRESYYAAGWAMWQARAALAQQAATPTGWKLVQVNDKFDALMTALDRAARKGYMPDAMSEEWEAFDYNEAAAPTPAAQAEPAGPGDMAVYQAMADRYAALAARGAQAEPEGGAA